MNVTTLQAVELGVLGPLQVRQDGTPVAIPGAKPRAILTMLGLHDGSVVPADVLIKLLWGDDPPRTAAKALQTHVSSLRRTLGDGVVVTEGAGWRLNGAEVDASRYKLAAKSGRDATAAGDTSQAAARFEEALVLWRGIPELPDGQRGLSEKTRWIESHAALVEDRADALLATGRAAEVIGDLEAAVAEAPLRERRWGQLMLALYRAGRQGEALGAYQRARSLLADELGVDPGPELRRLETAIVAQDHSLDIAVAQQLPSVTRAVTFLLTDIEGSTAAWEADAASMAAALARHDELVEQVVTSRGGRLIKTRGEGDATFSVFERPSGAAAAAIELQDAITHEPWASRDPIRVRMALHTGEVELRDGDYFGRAVNRVARLRSLADGGQILCSGATAELVIDSLADDVMLDDLGMRQLKNLARPEHVFELRLETAELLPPPPTAEAPMQRPALPAVLVGPGPFVGRGRELERLLSVWQTALAGGVPTVLIAGEPGVGKTRLAGEWSQRAYEQGAVVLYGRCDEDLGAPYQPFAEALRSLVPCMGADRLRGLRGVEALLPLVPGLTDVVPDLAPPTRADPDTERYALFDAVVALLEMASKGAPVLLILDDLHWAAKPTLLLLRHLLRFGDHAHVQVVGTYRSTDLDRSHPLAAMLADLHRDGTANRLSLSGLDEDDVTTYVAEAGYDDEELAHALASVTGGNPFFLIEALRHVDESGGVWDQSTLPQGVREAVSRRLSRLPVDTNKALAAAAVVGSRFAVELVEQVVGNDLVDAFEEACQAGIVIEEPGGHYRFNHAIVRQSLLAELASVRRMRLHQRIATTLETLPGADDELLAELAHHYFECAWAGNAAKAVEYCRRAADQAMTRLAYEGAADLYHQALHALEEIDEELPDRNDQIAELLVARCEALLAAGDVASAAGAVSQLQETTVDSARLAAWATCFDGQLSMLIHPERLDEVEAALGAAAAKFAQLDDAAGEAKAHTVRAGCLARLGRIADCEIALDDALTAARRAREHRRVNAVLAGAPLAALWGPNPVPRAGGRCLDVVRLLRITTDSPAVEATSTRCQAVLEAFRGRTAAARRMIDSARRTVTELGLRHAFLEVEQFAGIVELIADEPAAAEAHLRKAYKGFRRMGLDADTAETAALLGRTYLALGRDVEADELCTESERLAGHALKASMGWRTLRAHLLSRGNDHDGARRVAEAAVTLAERTDALVDHGDACLTLATVLAAAGDIAGARAAAEQAIDLYERKGAAALADKARSLLDKRVEAIDPTPPEAPPMIEFDTACVRAGERVATAFNRGDREEYERLFAPEASLESRRKIVGFAQNDIPFDDWQRQNRRMLETGEMRVAYEFIAVRGERLALSRLSAGTADASPGAPIDELLQVYAIDEEGRVALQIWFDVEDMDAAIAELDALQARFEEQRPQARRLENAASHAVERHSEHFAARDWDALAKVIADDILVDDRRPVVNAGIKRGRDAEIANLRAVADVGITYTAFVLIAARGERLVLTRASVGGGGSAEFTTDALSVVELNSDSQIAAMVLFDLDDFDAAIAELDARYLAGEAAAHVRTWSVVAAAYAAFNRHELPATTPDWVNIDHRRGTSIAPGEMPGLLGAAFIESVHLLNDLGTVVTHMAHETSQDGFDAEWRVISVITVKDDMINRTEVFDETDCDAAMTRLIQLSCPASRLENAASQADQRFWTCFAARDWLAMAELFSDGISTDDRRRVVNAGVLHGRDVHIENMRALAEIQAKITSAGIATRGERLALSRIRSANHDLRHGEFGSELLYLIEVDGDERIAAGVFFEPDDFDAAFEELDARYLAGEAAAHARTWSVITRAYAALNRREHPATTPDWVNIDHRRGISFAPGHVSALLTKWLATPDLSNSIEAVHRLDDLGAVVTSVTHETSQEGFEAEWRGISVLTTDGEFIDRLEVFDEADLDAAIARFEELHPTTRRLENAASRANARIIANVNAREWDAAASLLADDHYSDDRRRVTGAGVRRGRDADIENFRVIADLGANITVEVIATRGDCLVLTRNRVELGDEQPPFTADFLGVVETNRDGGAAAVIELDLEDLDAAIAELDARFLAGEAASHAHTWSVIAGVFDAHNRREVAATTPDVVSIDHRRVAGFASGEGFEYIRAGWELDQSLNIYIEAAHRVNGLGAVFTWAGHGTSHEGFEAEWRGVTIMTVDGGMVSRMEVFDDADLDSAIARFEELQPMAPRLENAASQAADRFRAHFAARDWDAMAQATADNYYSDDRRCVVGAGVRFGRDAAIDNYRALADVGFTSILSTVIATRGEHVVLSRMHLPSRDKLSEPFRMELLGVIEINARNRIVAVVVFDHDDFDAAIAELDARYLAGEAAAHPRIWSLISGSYAAINRHEEPATTTDWITVDHRRETAMGPGDLMAYLGAGPDPDPDNKAYVEAVHRLTDPAAVVTYAAHETSQGGFDAEWRGIAVFTVERDRINRTEVFDEADLDAALARFDQLSRPAPRLENTATRVFESLYSHVAADEWHAVAQIAAENVSVDDRRRVVNAGILHGRDANIKDAQATVGVGFTMTMLNVLATRGERLALTGIRVSGRDPEAIQNDALQIMEIDAEERIAGVVVFDLEDFDAAITELDARYLAGEAAAHARTWSVISNCFATLSRHELPSTATDLVDIDHRQGAAFAPGELMQYLRAGWEVNQSTRTYVEVVHRLNNFGAVVTHAADLISRQGFEAEWRSIDIFTINSDEINRAEVFDEADLDAALARFEELQPQAPRLENAAIRVWERFQTYLDATGWVEMAKMTAEDIIIDDRRRVIGAGLQRGRDVNVANIRTSHAIGIKNVTSTVIATRGEHLVLDHLHFSGQDPTPEPFGTEMLRVLEIDQDERIAAGIFFDANDADAAFAELDSRYLAGEAATAAHTWSVVAAGYDALNRGELPAVTPDLVNVDHRRVAPYAPGDLVAYIHAFIGQIPDASFRVESVHRLSDLGTVVTHVLHGTSQEGFDAEWRAIHLATVAGDMVNRSEMFEETDLDGALARFDELQPQTRCLENAASQVAEQFLEYFAVRDWDAMAELLADDMSSDDRRRVINGGLRRGRDAEMASWRATGDVWTTNVRSTVVATRGERLALIRLAFAAQDQQPDAFQLAALVIIEINEDRRIGASVAMASDDLDAALTELDARYLAGEAAPHAQTWSVVAGSYAGFNRRELSATTPDWVNIDHRRGAGFAPGDMIAYLQAAFDDSPDTKIYIAAVHRLSNIGAVVTHVAHGVSREGFDAEWRDIHVLTVEDDQLNRSELFDETELDAALARFDELNAPARRLENAASRADERVFALFAARDWDSMAEILADEFYSDDRRPMVNVGIRHGLDVTIANMQTSAKLGLTFAMSRPIATRGERLVLSRARWSSSDQGEEEFHTDALSIVEINSDERIALRIWFDTNDFDSAFAELDSRYIVGEAAAHAETWSVIAQGYAALNRNEVPESAPDYVNIDRRLHATIAAGDLAKNMRAAWDLTPDLKGYVEAVHRLSDLGAVVTHAAEGTTPEGLHAEWRGVHVLTLDGDMVNRCEMFDEADLDAALARFDELHTQTHRLKNAASQVYERFQAHFAARDWDAIAEMLVTNPHSDDRRPVVGGGIRHGRDALIQDLRATAAVGVTNATSDVIATRGERLALAHARYSRSATEPDAFHVDYLQLVEIDTDEHITALVAFDRTDIDAALKELDARYLAGEGAPDARTWSVVASSFAAFNRHEVPAADWVTIDHRRSTPFEPSNMTPSIRTIWDLTPNLSIHIEAVHRLNDFGAVITHEGQGTSQEGFDAEWRAVDILMVDGDSIVRCEVFDEEDVDAALARFDELRPPIPRLENPASRVHTRLKARVAARDWNALAEILADDVAIDDRRRAVNSGIQYGREAAIADMRGAIDLGLTNISSTVIATRGVRLELCRTCIWGEDRPDAFRIEFLSVVEINADERIVARVAFDLDDIDAAFEELETRYLAGEAAAHAQTWSLIARAYAALNRGEIPATAPHVVDIDHRSLAALGTGEMIPYVRAVLEDVALSRIYAEAVHRLGDLGAVISHAADGTSPEGFDAEWRHVQLLTFEGDRINRCEIFDEADLDAALARFEELES